MAFEETGEEGGEEGWGWGECSRGRREWEELGVADGEVEGGHGEGEGEGR